MSMVKIVAGDKLVIAKVDKIAAKPMRTAKITNKPY